MIKTTDNQAVRALADSRGTSGASLVSYGSALRPRSARATKTLRRGHNTALASYPGLVGEPHYRAGTTSSRTCGSALGPRSARATQTLRRGENTALASYPGLVGEPHYRAGTTSSRTCGSALGPRSARATQTLCRGENTALASYTDLVGEPPTLRGPPARGAAKQPAWKRQESRPPKQLAVVPAAFTPGQRGKYHRPALGGANGD
ncbi:hypothetical protein DPMN_087070 [Dreissena polymorpha]|uniref:Uncharacterized protein n=1 Tax=Dreissena polymorpha TaxID=45954 RepID=A0A9D4KRK5_DREPO|nr:hypothetical protein DPMN_087070 [Dreissena polymorpha]